MAIGILAPPGSAQARLLIRHLASVRPETEIVHAELDGAVPIRLDETGVDWNGIALGRLESLYLHGFAYEDPVLPPAEPACDWSLWQCGHVVAQQRHSFLYSVLSRLEAGGLRLYNPVSALLGAFDRFGQLDGLALAGLATPPLIVTNDPAAAQRFADEHGACVWRPVSGGGAWQRFTERQRRYLVAPDRPPVMIAGVVPGPLLRGFVVDGLPVLCVATAAPHRGEVEQLESFRAVPPATVPAVGRIAEAAGSLGLRWAAVLFVATAAGPVIYDVDPDPVLTDLPAGVAEPLLEVLAARLAGLPARAARVEEGILTRPSLLLRRMLAIQFDMEASKYAETDPPPNPAPAPGPAPR